MPFQLLREENNEFEFASFVPDNFADLKNPPLIVFLHGSGERGEDPGLPLKGNAYVFESLQLPAVIIFPQCISEFRAFYGEMEERVARSIGIAEEQLGANSNKLYFVGYSMGGSSCLWLAARHPGKIRRIACIAPGITWMGEEDPPYLPDDQRDFFHTMFVEQNRPEIIARNIKDTPIWFLQGTYDEPCPIEETRDVISNLRKLGAEPIVTEYEGVDHESLTMALEEEGLFEWLLAD